MTYQSAYPNARILFADEKSFKADNRVNFFNQIKNNDYDCVIMSHDQFGRNPAVAGDAATDSSGGA